MIKFLVRTLVPSTLRGAIYEARQRPLKDEASQWLSDHFTSDLTIWERQFQQAFGRPMNWEHPSTFNEKLRWIMRYDRRPIMTQCADKFAVRQFVADQGLERILNPLHGVWTDPHEINFDTLPETWAIKVNHGSGQNIFRRDTTRPPNVERIRKQFAVWMKRSEYWRSREWAYKNIPPRIICEALLSDENGQAPRDYKFFCFGGTPRFVQVNSDRFTHERLDFFDLDWRLLPFNLGGYQSSGQRIEPPETLADMTGYAQLLSRNFPFVRVDFYTMGGRVVFGEMTLYPNGGIKPITPEEYDTRYGEMIALPKATR